MKHLRLLLRSFLASFPYIALGFRCKQICLNLLCLFLKNVTFMSRNSCILSLLTWSLLDDDSSIWHSSQQDGFLRQNFKQVLPELLCQISMCLFVFTLLTFNPKSGELKTGEYNNRWIISALELFTNLERCVLFWASQCKEDTSVVEGYRDGQVAGGHELQGEAEELGCFNL